MKLTTFFILITCLRVSADGYAQKVTLSEKNSSLLKVFNEIKKQTGFIFFYNEELLKEAKPVTIKVKEAPLQSALDICLKEQKLTYSIVGENIVIKPAVTPPNPDILNAGETPPPPPPTEIKGTVQNEQGERLAAASVIIKGTDKGISTDNNGEFKISVSASDVLAVSLVGYKTQEVKVGSQTTINIVLAAANKELETIVVTGLGIKRAARSTAYNVQSIGGNEVNEVKDANFVNSLNGKVAGATINASSSGVGGSSRVILRGVKSITGNNNALYVVDGIPLPNLFSPQVGNGFGGSEGGEGIANINPDDIESISVLTGASAAAIYGGSAANGVILITTKKGKAGKTTVNFTSNTTFSSPFILPELQNTYGVVPPDPGSTKASFVSYGPKLETPSSYQVKDFFQTGANYNNTVSVSTGSEKSQSYFSAASINATGIIPNNKYTRYNFTARNTSNLIADKLTLDVSAMYVVQNQQNIPATGQYHNPLVGVYLFPAAGSIDDARNYERFDVLRNFSTQYWPYGDLGMSAENPYWIINREKTESKRERFLGSLSLKYTIANGLTLTGRVKYDNSNDESSVKYNASTIAIFAYGDNGYYRTGRANNKQTYADLLLNYTKQFTNFSVNATLGTSVLDNKTSDFSSGGPLLKVPNFFSLSNIARSELVTNETLQRQNQTQAVFANAQFGFKNMLFLDITGRNDWASALAYTSNTSVFYPSIGLSAIVSDMATLPKAVSYLKLRGSYSEVGNAPQPYVSNPTYGIGNGTIGTVSSIPFVTLKPERTKSVEAGIDLRMFKNNASLSVTAYDANTTNQIFQVGVSGGVGVSSYYINAGKINNKGIEASLGYTAKLGRLQWNPMIVFSLNRSTIKELLAPYVDPVSGQTKRQDTLGVGGVTKLITGRGTGDIYVAGFQRDSKGAVVVDANGLPVVNQQLGILMGSVNPDYNIGFNNGFSYKNFNLSFLINARVGGKTIGGTQGTFDAYGVSQKSAVVRDNGGVDVYDKLIPARDYFTVAQNALEQYTYDATNVRLGEFSLGYTIPAKLFSNKIQAIKLGLVARNLWMIYSNVPYDPENAASTGTFYQGYDYFNPPSLRSIGFKVNVSF